MTIDTNALRKALSRMHARACGDVSAVYMSIPADPGRDADLLLAAGIDEIDALRARLDEARGVLSRLGHAASLPHDACCNLIDSGGPCNCVLGEVDAVLRGDA